MSKGRKIYRSCLASECVERKIPLLGNGSLRALLRSLDHPAGEPPCDQRNLIEGIALVEAARRWMKKKGKGAIL